MSGTTGFATPETTNPTTQTMRTKSHTIRKPGKPGKEFERKGIATPGNQRKEIAGIRAEEIAGQKRKHRNGKPPDQPTTTPTPNPTTHTTQHMTQHTRERTHEKETRRNDTPQTTTQKPRQPIHTTQRIHRTNEMRKKGGTTRQTKRINNERTTHHTQTNDTQYSPHITHKIKPNRKPTHNAHTYMHITYIQKGCSMKAKPTRPKLLPTRITEIRIGK